MIRQRLQELKKLLRGDIEDAYRESDLARVGIDGFTAAEAKKQALRDLDELCDAVKCKRRIKGKGE